MNINISLIEKKAKRFFLSHRKTSYTIGLFFICCCLYVDFVTISNTCKKINNLEYKEGVVSYWEHTGGEFNDATLKIKNDTNVYITQRYDGWLCFQHNEKKGETVAFYTVNPSLPPHFRIIVTVTVLSSFFSWALCPTNFILFEW
ncbi:hypothetical protein [Prevotella jejuni]